MSTEGDSAPPLDVVTWFRDLFAECNRRVTRKLSLTPNVHEESLDFTLIEHLSQYTAPIRLNSGWIVRVDTHFLGGMRHFLGRWEIGDIGLLVHYRRGTKRLRSKAAILQSKRLYPSVGPVHEDMRIDYEIGFARLASPDDPPLFEQAQFDFDFDSEYSALRAHDHQHRAIRDYSRSSRVPIFYQFYNPATLPFIQTFPLSSQVRLDEFPFATRVVPASTVLGLLDPLPENRSLCVQQLSGSVDSFEYGWRLEHFVADQLIGCKVGYLFENTSDDYIYNLFNRRTGPIAAAVSFSIEAPA